MRIELWSIYFPPDPLGVGPVAGTLAKELVKRGHSVTAVTSHPHYPRPDWGTSWRRCRYTWEGVEVVELPVYPRRQSVLQRVGEELTYGFKQTTWGVLPSQSDIVIATVPSLLSVVGAYARSRLYRTPWVVWLQDIVSVGAQSTGLPGGAFIAPLLNRIERDAFQAADRTIVISESFRRKLLALGVAQDRIERIYLGSPRIPRTVAEPSATNPVILVIGNVGLTQNLVEFVRAFERSESLRALGAELRIAGHGVQAGAVRDAVRSERVKYLGLLSENELTSQLREATVGLVSQSAGVSEFNLPSKAITYMACGLPVYAVVDPRTEISRLVVESGAGEAVSNGDLAHACERLADLLASDDRLQAAATAALGFSRDHFGAEAMAAEFERVLLDVVSRRR